MSKPKISIIVPVYNAAGTLRKTAESILQQIESGFELIFVDDGSKDRSGIICDGYADEDNRVFVIHQANAGVSAARNAGIDVAQGKYIGFADADDWIAPEMFQRLLDEAEATDADVVMCDATTVFSDGRVQADTITQLSLDTILQKKDFTPSLLAEMAGSVWRCIYKNDRYNDKLRKYPLAFPPGVKFSEDRIFNLYAFGQADRVAYIKESYYYRLMHAESTVHRFHADYFEANKKAATEIEKAIRLVWDNNDALRKAYFHQFFSGALGAVCNYYYRTSTLTKAERRTAVKKLCEDEQLQKALKEAGHLTRRERWLQEKQAHLLIAYARLANLKHGR